MKILLVDGSNFVLEVMSSKLSKKFPDAQFMKAKYLNLAFNEALEHSFDLIVTNFHMPFEEWIGLSNALSETGDNHETPTILFSKNDENAHSEATELISAYSHMTTADGVDELLCAAEAILNPENAFEKAA